MALLRMKTWIDGHTGDVLSRLGERPNAHAVPAASDVCAPGRAPRLDALPAGRTLTIDTRLDLRAFRLDRDARRHGERRSFAQTYPEVKAALAHPRAILLFVRRVLAVWVDSGSGHFVLGMAVWWPWER